MDEAVGSYDAKHPALLPSNHWISLLITRHAHQYGHNGVAATTARTRRKFWILKGNKLRKAVKFKCRFCREMAHKAETQLMANLPTLRLAPYTPPFYMIACDYFGPYNVKISRNKTAKHYGVLFTCLNTRADHLEMAPFNDGVSSSPEKILSHTRLTSSHTEWQWLSVCRCQERTASDGRRHKQRRS